MKKLLAFVSLALLGGAFAASPHLEERTSKPAEVMSDLPEIYLIGDSIRMGYCGDVAKELKGRAEVKWPGVNCGNTQNVLVNLGYWRQFASKPKVVQFNCGQWDAAHFDGDAESLTSVDEYRRNVRLIIRRLRKYYPGAKIVYATTTPMNPKGVMGGDRRTTAEIRRYNAVGVEVAKAEDVLVNDLFAQTEKWPASDWADYCHFNAAANARLGKFVADYLMTLVAGSDEDSAAAP